MREGSSRTSRIATSIALAALGALLLVRAGELSARPPRLTAHGEKLWYGWAWRDPKLVETLKRIEPQLRPGEIVYLAGPKGVEASWLRAMALYFWPRQTLCGVVAAGSNEPPRGRTAAAPKPGEGVTFVRISETGHFRIDRISDVAR
jgi:hypothetical protein